MNLTSTKFAMFAGVVSGIVAGNACSSSPKPRPMTLQEMVAADPLPLSKGAKWSYKVSVLRYDPSKEAEVKQELDWASEVIDVRETNGVTAYVIKGWPTDLMDFETTPVASEKTILRSDNTFLWSDKPEPSMDGAEGWFTWPLIDGQKICPTAEMTYCWQVASIETGYSLTYYTGPDEVIYDLSPGTGVSRFRYSHHGTTNTVDAKLTSFKKGSGPTK
jgi:hypothetical protein